MHPAPPEPAASTRQSQRRLAIVFVVMFVVYQLPEGLGMRTLDQQIRTLNDANNAAQLEIGTIIKSNGTLLSSVEENCGRPKRDTGKGGGTRDTTHKPVGGKPGERRPARPQRTDRSRGRNR